ncbi:MAG: YceI family protein [Bacteroidetes bacterium]|nr:YceI family protein [Bacteroidota bacterium]
MENLTNWVIDPSHSEIAFRVKHLMISRVKGVFGTYQAQVQTNGDDFSTASVNFTADTASIDTGDVNRDGHVRSADFFDCEKFPHLSFQGKGLTKVDGANRYAITGDLTIKGTTKPVTLNVTLEGVMKDPWGNLKAGVSVEGTINRKEFGLEWNTPLDGGGFLLADDVHILCEVQLLKAETAAA